MINFDPFFIRNATSTNYTRMDWNSLSRFLAILPLRIMLVSF